MHACKKLIALLMVILLVGVQWISSGAHHAQAKVIDNAITVSAPDLDKDGNPALPMTVVDVDNNTTALDVLQKVVKDLDAPNNPEYGAYINAINGVKPTGEAYWGFFVNGVASKVGISSYKVKPGDDLLFKIVNYPPEEITTQVALVDPDGNALLNSKGEKILDKSLKVIKGANAYDVFKQALGDNFHTSLDNKFFAFINSIDGVELGEGKYWSFNVNDNPAKVGISTYIPKDGERLTLVGDTSNTNDDSDTDSNTSETDNSNTDTDNTDNRADQKDKTITIKENVLTKAIDSAMYYLNSNSVNDFYGAMAYRILGEKLSQSYINEVAQTVKDNDGTFRNVTDYDKNILAITAAGGDATDFGGYNLIKGIYNNDRMTNQGNNGPIYSLLALDSGDYSVPSGSKWTREKLIDFILSNQNSNGGWALFGDQSSPDITGMALASLAPYKDRDKVKSAIQKSVQWLSSEQNDTGGYGIESNGGDSSESTAQVIIGLTAVGVDPTSQDFTKSKGNLVSHLISFQQKDGGFGHISNEKSNAISTPQGLLALASYQKYLKDKTTPLQFNNDGKEIKIEVNTKAGISQQQTGAKLPNTATHIYSFLMISLLLIMIGILLFVYNRKKKRA